MAKRLAKLMVLLLALPHLAATCQGTETGNPQQNGGSGGGGETGCPALRVSALQKAATGSEEVLDDLILRICQRVVGCGMATTVDSCVNALNAGDGDRMTDELGRPEGTTIVQLRAELISGSVVADEAAAVSCEADVSEAPCEDVIANVSPPDFSGVENLIPASCAEVFGDGDAATDAPSSGDGGCP